MIWSGVNVADNIGYTVSKPETVSIKLHTYQVQVAVKDPLGLPVSGALVNLTFVNGTNAVIPTDASGVASFGYVPFGTFKGFVNFLGDFSAVAADTEGSQTVVSSVILSYPLMSMAVAVDIISGVLFYLACPKLYRWRFRLREK